MGKMKAERLQKLADKCRGEAIVAPSRQQRVALNELALEYDQLAVRATKRRRVAALSDGLFCERDDRSETPVDPDLAGIVDEHERMRARGIRLMAKVLHRAPVTS